MAHINCGLRNRKSNDNIFIVLFMEMTLRHTVLERCCGHSKYCTCFYTWPLSAASWIWTSPVIEIRFVGYVCFGQTGAVITAPFPFCILLPTVEADLCCALWPQALKQALSDVSQKITELHRDLKVNSFSKPFYWESYIILLSNGIISFETLGRFNCIWSH